MKNFKLNSEELELLLAFEAGDGLEKLAKSIGRDPTVVSRMLKRISEKSHTLEKSSGRWKLTEVGRKLNSLTNDMILAQESILNEELTLRIGSNREFSSRVLIKSINELKEKMGIKLLIIKTFESGTEKSLLEGQIDVALDCGKPYSPEISYKLCVEEPISVVCSPSFYKKYQQNFEAQNLSEIPMILIDRLFPEKFEPNKGPYNYSLSFNDISAGRVAAIEGLGWAYMPLYAVKEEIKSKLLVLPFKKYHAREKYGVWWLRSRKQILPIVKTLETWLTQQTLSI